MRLLTLVLFVVTVSAPAGAEDFFPTHVGSIWEYIGLDSGDPYVTECVATETVWGIECGVFTNDGPGDEGLVQYWYKDANGDVRIRAWFRTIGDYGSLFDPGIKMMSGAPFVGEEWCTTVDAYHLPDTSFVGSFASCHVIESEGPLDLPAGTFYAYGVGEPEPLMLIEEHDTLGRDLSSPLREITRWYSEAVGEVKYVTADTYELTGYSIPPTPVGGRTWGEIKALFMSGRRH
ncbi:hypothetical protein ACFL6M_05515 [Candidatus Eisenbacteria bacterium]|uniref:Uncharacterized protein n=1 Tax=Eiseniibacteriota bacterium TaxID=2212470 RepID=A0ABV6YLK0_UNCEI